MISLFTRNVIEQFLRATGQRIPQVEQTEFATSTATPIDYFDTTSMPKLPAKFYPGERVPSPLLVIHVTDITGGFGVDPKRVAYWRRELESDRFAFNENAKLVAQLPPAGWGDDGIDRWCIEQAHRLALWERFGRTSYHWVAARNGDAIKNHPATRRTKHGNGGNDGVGVAIDCGHNEVLPASLIETGRHVVRRALEDMHRRVDPLQCPARGWCPDDCPSLRGDPRCADVMVLTQPHRCYSPKRRADTSARVWQEIVLPVVAATSWARVDYELARDGGRPIPRSWDPNALYDDKGRRIGR